MPPSIQPILTSAAPWWWVGPAILLFCWAVVPVMRLLHNVMNEDDYSNAARFWWFASWVPFGLTGLGLSLAAVPLLASPWVTGLHPTPSWPPAWLGLKADLTAVQCLWALVAGGTLALGGLKWALFAWLRQRQASLFIWRAHLRDRIDRSARARRTPVPDDDEEA